MNNIRNKKYTIGIIGAGMYGKVLGRWLTQAERARLKWVNSASMATTQSAAKELGAEKFTLDYREVLADPEVDAVIIATPPYLHAEQFCAAIDAKKHILIEKPLAESPESVERIVSKAKEASDKVILEVSCRHTRLTRKFMFIKAIIDSGKLGEIYHIHHNHLQRQTFIEWNPRGAWAMNKNLGGGGPFLDWGVYDLSFHLGLMDDIPELQSVKSFTRNDLRDMHKLVSFSDIEQHGAAWLTFSGGLTYYYERGSGVHGETPNETRLYGTKGGLKFNFTSWDINEVHYYFLKDDQPRKEILTIDTGGMEDDGQAIVNHFLDCLEGKSEPLMTVETSAKHMRILFKILYG